MIKIGFKNTLLDRIYVGVGVTIVLGLTVFSVVSSSTIKEVEATRLTMLDSKEVSKLAIVESVRYLLMVKDEKSYAIAKDNCNFTKEYKNEIYGSSFNGSKYFYADGVSMIDAQYSLDGEKYFLVANATKGAKNYLLNIVVSTSGGLIYDISLV